jgi:hypothetical protein
VEDAINPDLFDEDFEEEFEDFDFDEEELEEIEDFLADESDEDPF